MNEFFKTKTKELTVTTFNEKTYLENITYRKKKNIECIYSCFEPIGSTIDGNKGIYVLEADVTNNKIRGIGFIRKNGNNATTRTIYENNEYNFYSYMGNYHITREDMLYEREEEVMKILDRLCFYGKTHLKRYAGIKRFPKKWIYNMSKSTDILDFITKMFETRKSKKTTTQIKE
jgi:hypothetical protein